MARFCNYPDCDFIACGGEGKRPPPPPPPPKEEPPAKNGK